MRILRVIGVALLSAIVLTGCVTSIQPETNEAQATSKPIDLDVMRTQCVRVALDDVPLEEQIRSVLMVHVAGLDRRVITTTLAATRPGGLIAMADNIGAAPINTAEVFAGLTAPVNGVELPLLLSVDQEGGFVSRIPQDTFAAGSELQGQPPEVVQQAFASRAALVRESGLNTNFGIVADVTENPSSFIFPRVLGVTPDAAASGVRAAVAGERGTVLSTLKHFPGHGATTLDSHSSLPTVSGNLASWRATAAVPFLAGIEEGAELVMMGHLVFSEVDALPASQSARWVEVLREDLGFEGVIITDDMRMLEDSGVADYADVTANSVRAMQAGVSMLLFVGPSEPTELVTFVDSVVAALSAAVERGELSRDAVTDAAARVYEARRNLSDPDPRSWCRLFAGQYSVTETP